ncbi:MAG TPA: helix-turn-helix domain-containing protein [Methanocorpusculum sp.]|nr:helix-turn-helix domain-containing protein [Methanocorpusculum sp.]
MFQQRIFDVDFSIALNEELSRRGMSIRQLSELTGIAAVTLYKISSGERDPRLSTIKKISAVFTPYREKFIAVIAAKFLLDSIAGAEVTVKGRRYKIRGYSANSYEECLIASINAKDEGAAGIVCAPIISSVIEKLVDVPVAMMKPDMNGILVAVKSIEKRI